jgi:hypothetical protein
MKEYRQIAGHTPSVVPSFLLGTGPGRQMYTLIDSYCDDPECAKGEGNIRLQAEREPEKVLDFWFNFHDGRVKAERDPGEEAKGIIDLFLEQNRDLLERRRQAVRAWGLAKLRGKREYVQGRTYGFLDFTAVKDSFAIPFRNEGKRWTVIDMYCVNPDCSCNESFLQFFDASGKERGSRVEPSAAVMIDLKSGATARPEESDLPLPEPALLASFQGSLGDWYGELKLRMELLRRVAWKKLRFQNDLIESAGTSPISSSPATPTLIVPAGRSPSPILFGKPPLERDTGEGPTRPQVGRNDPCPCGSGKKFKKCCGR